MSDAFPSSIRTRTVAIVGRPNVGKSALFNRLVGRRLAIVHEASGVTRDRLAAEVNFEEKRFDIIDTGGIGYMDGSTPEGVIDKGIIQQVEIAIQDASVLILVVDITTGRVPLDEGVARLLHESGRPVFIAANKADNDELDVQAVDFETLGFPVFPVSAMHNRGIGYLMDAVLPRLPEQENPTIENPIKIAIVGRPNAGKSSYINRLIRNERVIVSEVPGTTRDSIEVPFTVGSGPEARHYKLIDTAGVRRAGKIKDVVEYFSVMRTEKSIEQADVAVLVLDAAEGPRGRDKKLASMIMEKNTGCILLINKWDLAEGVTTQRAYGAALSEAVPFLNFAPVIFVSAQSGYNIRRSIEAIDYVAEQVSKKLSTGVLNRVMQDAVAKVQPPMVKSTRLKIYYCTQVTANPIRIKCFVNDPKKVTPAYKAYLIKSLRAKFGLEGAPLTLLFSDRPKKQIED